MLCSFGFRATIISSKSLKAHLIIYKRTGLPAEASRVGRGSDTLPLLRDETFGQAWVPIAIGREGCVAWTKGVDVGWQFNTH